MHCIRVCFTTLCLIAVWGAASSADTVTLSAIKDNTIYADPDTVLSNGAGHHMFAGKPGIRFLRRALVQFPVAGNIPPGSTIHSTVLTLHMSRALVGTSPQMAWRVLAPWGEGTSHALGEEGMGAPATLGDVTWFYAIYPSVEWSNQGGDVVFAESATTMVTDIGYYSWSGIGIVNDVQRWVDDPFSNYGWMIFGDETAEKKSARRWDTREHPDAAVRPKLVVTYTPPTIPVNETTWGQIKAHYEDR